ncbi:MAG: DUF2628 domain-containing protein [Devosia sp.]|nr:DUF2628 domain-containing protein [Devosia sp.]
MTTYAVFDRDAKDAVAVVPDRFSWFATLLPPVFALVHGLWLEFFVYLVLVALLSASSVAIGDDAAFWIYVVLAVWIGFEASAMRRGALTRGGWRYRTDVIARGDDLAELEGIRIRRP